MALGSFRGRHAGEPCAVLGNGPTLADHGHRDIPCQIIGTNRSWTILPADYHIIAERKHFDVWKGMATTLVRGPLFTAGDMGLSERCHTIPLLRDGTTFSRDMEQGVVVSIGRAGSVVFAAIQLAVYLGFGPIYLLGVDLYGDHFDGTPASKELHLQNELFRLVPKDVEVFVVGSPESKAVFPKRTWEEVWP